MTPRDSEVPGWRRLARQPSRYERFERRFAVAAAVFMVLTATSAWFSLSIALFFSSGGSGGGGSGAIGGIVFLAFVGAGFVSLIGSIVGVIGVFKKEMTKFPLYRLSATANYLALASFIAILVIK